MLLLTVGVLQDRHDIAEQVRSQYQHFVVDEYQDVSPLQQRLLELWLGDRDSLCVVGDASQTIYSFTGATPDHLLDFRTRHPEATVVKLVRDYRSTPQVVHLANGLLAQAQRPRRRAPAGAGLPARPGPRARLHRVRRRARRGRGHRPPDPRSDRLRRAAPARSPCSSASTAQSEVYEQALADAGVPYQLRGAERFFERPEVRKAGVALRGAARFGGNDSLLDDAVDLPSQVRAVLSGEGLDQPSRRPVPARSGTAGSRWPPWCGSPQDFAARQDRAPPSPTSWPNWTSGRTPSTPRPSRASPSPPCTRPRAWSGTPSSWSGLTEGMMPITYAKTDEQVEEERRLLYVGVTRARQHLHVSWALSRSPGGRAGRRPSRFLDGLRPGSAAVPGRARQAGRRRRRARRRERRRRRRVAGSRSPARCRVCGRTLTDAGEMKLMRCEDCPSDMDEGLYERLREWRAVQAQRSGQPAFCVFTDKTLMAIAEAAPDDDGRAGPASPASACASSTGSGPTFWPSAQARSLEDGGRGATDAELVEKIVCACPGNPHRFLTTETAAFSEALVPCCT